MIVLFGPKLTLSGCVRSEGKFRVVAKLWKIDIRGQGDIAMNAQMTMNTRMKPTAILQNDITPEGSEFSVKVPGRGCVVLGVLPA